MGLSSEGHINWKRLETEYYNRTQSVFYCVPIPKFRDWERGNVVIRMGKDHGVGLSGGLIYPSTRIPIYVLLPAP
jgi:hypothetical protein